MNKENLSTLVNDIIEIIKLGIETIIKYVISGNEEIDKLKYIVISNLLNGKIKSEQISLIVEVINIFQICFLITLTITSIILFRKKLKNNFIEQMLNLGTLEQSEKVHCSKIYTP